MYVCSCAAVTESEVRGCVAAGARTVGEIGERCEAGTCCGSCLERIGALLGATLGTDIERDQLLRSA
ncbi:MAG: (2Fe-2S)-binding protein [Actinomycetota bacterium]|nr:(2Fe-2S)-binding protein [Actinomycetota bacterium]